MCLKRRVLWLLKGALSPSGVGCVGRPGGEDAPRPDRQKEEGRCVEAGTAAPEPHFESTARRDGGEAEVGSWAW